MGTSRREEHGRELFVLESAFEASRSEEVPTYAPAAFAKAQRRLEDIRNDWCEYRANGNLDERIALARAALEAADAKASASRPLLSALVRARSDAIRSSALALHAARELNEAERQFHDAVRSAEEEDFSTARKLVAAVERSYAAAKVEACARGPGQRLEHQVEYARGLVSRRVHAQAQEELEELREAIEEARREAMPLHMLQATIASRSVQLRRLLDVRPGGPLDLDPRDPPLAPGGGLDPETFSRPKAPVTMRVTDRTADALTVVWRDRASFEDVNLLERSIADGPWEIIAQFGPLSGWGEFADTGLDPDTPHRYRVRVQNELGSSVTVHDDTAVGFTRTTEDLPVWRVQLFVRVADISDAGTSDEIQVRLTSPLVTYAPNGNNTWLDRAPRSISGTPLLWGDDFRRGAEALYDVDFSYIRQLSDITMISLRKEGTDAIGIAELALIVNGQEAFQKFFGETKSTCLWLDDEDGFSPVFTIYHPELRASSTWQSYVQAPPDFPQTIANDEIISRFEGIVGDSLHGTDAYWRKSERPVRVTRVNDETMNVRLLLAGAATGPNPDITIDFDLRVTISCNRAATDATLDLQTADVKVDAEFGLLIDLLGLAAAPIGPALVKYAEVLVERSVRNTWEPIVEHLAIEPPVPGFCPRVQVDQDADGNASLNFRPI